MKVYIDDREIKDEIVEFNQEDIVTTVQNSLDDSVIEQILLDDEKVNLQHFQQNELNLNKVDEIKFVTKKTGVLIEETLNEAQNYLPKLKEGVQEIARLIRRREKQLSGNKLMLAIEGFRWYTGVIDSISSLIDDEDIKNQIENELDQFNEVFDKALEKQKSGEYEKLADMLSGDIVDRITGFMNLNDKLLEQR